MDKDYTTEDPMDYSPFYKHVFATKQGDEDMVVDPNSLPAPLALGDLLLFGGHSLLSNLIKWTTDKYNHAISHCSVVFGERVMIEATADRGKNRVLFTPIQQAVQDYEGEVWVKYLTPQAHRRLNVDRMRYFFDLHSGEEYSRLQAFLALLGLETVDAYYGTKRWFCSKLAAEGYFAGGVLPHMGMGITPAELAFLPIFTKAYQIKGKRKELKEMR